MVDALDLTILPVLLLAAGLVSLSALLAGLVQRAAASRPAEWVWGEESRRCVDVRLTGAWPALRAVWSWFSVWDDVVRPEVRRDGPEGRAVAVRAVAPPVRPASSRRRCPRRRSSSRQH